MDLKELINLDKKKIILKNINNKSLGILQARDIKFSLRYNGISELSFIIDKDNCPYYNSVTSYRQIVVQDLMRFIISNPQVYNDGANEYKTVSCKSYEIDINRKSIPLLSGTYKFYSILPEDETIISIIMSYLPNWTIKEVDTSLWNIYRTFDLNDKPLLDFLMNECQTAYKTVFEFDTINKTISAKAYENIPKKTDISLSYNNLVQDLTMTEKTTELFTALEVKGSNVDINLVNPLGNVIYNFQHFLDGNFMSDELKTAIINWQNLIDTQQVVYANYLTGRRTKLSELIILQTELTELESQLKALEITRDALLEANLSAIAKNTEVKAKRVEITNKQTEIDNKQTEIDFIDNNLKTIQNTLKLNSYFNESQFLELEPFVIQTSITDDNFLVNDTDTELTKQNTAQDLYDKYKNLLVDSSQLRYELDTNLVDFISLNEYRVFSNQCQWGSQVTLKVNDKGDLVYPMLLGLDIEWNDNIDIRYLFSTEVKLKDAISNYDDFSNEVSNMSSKIASDSVKWSQYVNSGDKDRVFDLFSNGLNLDLIDVKSASSQSIVYDTTGLYGRKLLESGLYDDKQWKFINNKLVFTKNNYDSIEEAIGEIHLPDGSTSYGISAKVILGELLAGNQLVIKNANNSFILDSAGARLTDATLSILNSSGLNKILLDPNNGFKIQKKNGTLFEDMLFLDGNGEITTKANITGGSIGIGNGKFLVDSDGNLISTSATIKGKIEASLIESSTMNGGSITGTSINIGNGMFTCDIGGNVFSQSINIANKIISDANGVKIYGANIQWISSDPTIATAQSTADSALSRANSAQNTADSSYTVATLAGTNITKLSNGTYTGGGFINGKRIEFPEIYGGKISAIDMYSSKFHGSDINSAYLTLGTVQGNYGDLKLYRGGSGGVAFSIYDDISAINIKALGSTFMRTSGNYTEAYGIWDFGNATVNGVVAKFK